MYGIPPLKKGGYRKISFSLREQFKQTNFITLLKIMFSLFQTHSKNCM
jgi:hypothetical protein